MYHNLNQLHWQLKRDSCHGHNSKTCLRYDSKMCLVVLKTQFKEFIDSKAVNASNFHNKCWQKDFSDGATIEACLLTEGAILEACLVTGATLEACLVNEVRALDDNLVVKETTDYSVTSSVQLDESSSSQQLHAIFPQLDSGLVVPTFLPIDDPIVCLNKAMTFMVTVQQVQGRQCQHVAGVGSKEKILLVQAHESGQVLDENSSLGNENRSSDYERNSSRNENRSSNHESNSSGNDAYAKKMLVDTTASDIENDDIGPSYDSDTVSEVHLNMFEIVFTHGIQNHEQPKSNPDTYVVNENNSDITSDIPNMDPDRGKEEHDDVNYEQRCAFFSSLINSLKCDVEKCNEDKLIRLFKCYFQKETMFNPGKQGLCFENQNDNMNPSILNKLKELAPCLYNIDEMGKDELSDHKIISKEELKCEAEKRLKVKQRKSPLSYHGFVYAETQFEEPPKVPLKRRNTNLNKRLEQTQNLKEHFEQT
nr:hypothetical protein [Tanacetum cinerariifolium]